VPDKRTHRGPHPSDAELFAPKALADLRAALADFSLLLTKGYADKSALKLVGDRFSLTQRQRLAVMRSACSDQQRERRRRHCVDIDELADHPIAIDGYNLLITVEAAMSGGLIFRGRDGCFRDLASIHGTYRKVEETIPAVTLIGEFLTQIAVPRALWLLDRPVSNSGRLKALIGDLAGKNDWNWDIRLTFSPDTELSQTDTIVVTTDSVILDACQKWTNLAAEIITRRLSETTIVDFGSPAS